LFKAKYGRIRVFTSGVLTTNQQLIINIQIWHLVLDITNCKWTC